MPSISSWFWGFGGSSKDNNEESKQSEPSVIRSLQSNPQKGIPKLDPSVQALPIAPEEQQQSPLSPMTATTTTTTTTNTATSAFPNNLKLLFGGVTFLALSTLITRRAVARRQRAAIPPFYTGSRYHQPRANGALDAFEALNIATINVLSVSMVVMGGALYALDINNLDDMRRLVRGGLGVDGSGRSEQDVEEELEEWLATVLERKADKEKEKEKAKASKRRKVIVIDEDGEEEIEEVWRNERGKKR